MAHFRPKLSRPGPSSYQRQIRLFLLPYLLGMGILVLLPALATVVLAFANYDAVRPPGWAGLDNFQRLFDSPLVRTSLRNTVIFLALAVPLRLLGALILALLLQQRHRFFGLYRAAVYLPTIIPEAAYALIWLWILNPVYGPLNIVLRALGLPAPAWLSDPTTARLAIILLSVFQIGEGFVVLLTGLQGIPGVLYDSATVDGASGWQSFTRITLPLLMPWLSLLTFRDLLVSLQNTFAPSFMITYGGPYYATTFVPLLVYELSFDFADLGLASALLLVTYTLIGLLAMGMLNILSGARRDV
jgi:multiple sugar transport system permease protein